MDMKIHFLMPHSPEEDIKIKKDGILSGLNRFLKDMCKVKTLKFHVVTQISIQNVKLPKTMLHSYMIY